MAAHRSATPRRAAWSGPSRIPVPIHREPLYTHRRDLVEKYPTYEDRKRFWRLPTRYASIQAKDYSKDFPLIHTSGRLVEYEGGGEETRSNPWLAELQQDMFVEINPGDANDRGIKDGQWIWLEGPEGGAIKVKAMVTRRVGTRRGVHAVPLRRLVSRARTCSPSTRRARRRTFVVMRLQHGLHLRLRLGHPDAGNQGLPLPDHRGLGGTFNHGNE